MQFFSTTKYNTSNPSKRVLEQAKLLRQSVSFQLTTALNVENVPLILRIAAKNYKANALHDNRRFLEVKDLKGVYPELWLKCADILEEAAKIIDEEIKTYKEKEPKGKRFRPSL